ncbi:MAG: hypothetical protein HYY06_18095 [Deltaproteobacteria bacterium]|nr:hypothetical protein [Deltaproteobacteria bacterium]
MNGRGARGQLFDDILDDPLMEEVVNQQGTALVASCDVGGIGQAFPPRRIVEFIRSVDAAGNGGVVQSICQADLSPALLAVAHMVGSRLE